jgi:hypothetical protein
MLMRSWTSLRGRSDFTLCRQWRHSGSWRFLLIVIFVVKEGVVLGE